MVIAWLLLLRRPDGVPDISEEFLLPSFVLSLCQPPQPIVVRKRPGGESLVWEVGVRHISRLSIGVPRVERGCRIFMVLV